MRAGRFTEVHDTFFGSVHVLTVMLSLPLRDWDTAIQPSRNLRELKNHMGLFNVYTVH